MLDLFRNHIVGFPTRRLKYCHHFADYENKYQQTEQGIMDDCESVPRLRSEDLWDRACRFDIKDLGADCVKQQSFGFEDGQPCILLKMNRVGIYWYFIKSFTVFTPGF